MERRRGCCLFGGLVLLLVIGAAVGVIVYLTTNGSDTKQDDSPLVTVKQGVLRGLKMMTDTGKNSNTSVELPYFAFFGVPYAMPPVGKLRYKAPKPPASWDGTRNATVEPSLCSQSFNGVDVVGSEDCLYLNVYTPSLPNQSQEGQKPLMPVYFFIHGGKFQLGGASFDREGPDYFIEQKDIVVVTIQYRVNSYGFVSLDSEEMPGNCAIKDAIAALQWVNENIKSFGGDPNLVTIGGQSAGSCLAGWLTILPETKGLMRGAILQSGSALHSWSYGEDHVEMTLELASIVAGHKVTDKAEAEKYLMAAETESLTKATFKLIGDKMQSQPELPYRPTPERRVPGGEPLLITRDAESYFLDPPAPHVPQILGMTSEEWRFFYYGQNPNNDPNIDEKLLENLHLTVPKDLLPHADTRKILGLPENNIDYNIVIERVKEAIRAEVSPSCNLGCVLKKYYDGIWIGTDTHRLGAYLASRNETVYLYRFGVRTGLNRPFAVNPIPDDEKNAAQHGDDLPYTWATPENRGKLLTSSEWLTLRRMVSMWSSFIKHGKPIVETSDLLPVDWTPNTGTNLEVTFLDIGEKMTLRSESMPYNMIAFWTALYKEYRTPSQTPPNVANTTN